MNVFKYENGYLHFGNILKLPVEYRSVSSKDFESRQAVMKFENGWGLSIIWGSLTHSENYEHPDNCREFIETPESVEIAILLPEDSHHYIWGDVLNYVSVPDALFVVNRVKGFDSHLYNFPSDVYLDYDNEGNRKLSIEF